MNGLKKEIVGTQLVSGVTAERDCTISPTSVGGVKTFRKVSLVGGHYPKLRVMYRHV